VISPFASLTRPIELEWFLPAASLALMIHAPVEVPGAQGQGKVFDFFGATLNQNKLLFIARSPTMMMFVDRRDKELVNET